MSVAKAKKMTNLFSALYIFLTTDLFVMKSILLILLTSFLFTQFVRTQEIGVGQSAKNYPLHIVPSKGKIKTALVREMQGKIIILQWWGARCKGSEEALILFDHIAGKYKRDILFYAVTYDKLKNIQAFQTKNSYPFGFLRDKMQYKNEYFPAGPASHLVIIDQTGNCIYRGHPSVLTEALMDSLLKNNSLPEDIKLAQKKAFKSDVFHQSYKLPYGKTAFKITPYNPEIEKGSRYSTGSTYYIYNAPVYELYRDALFLNDYQIIISEALKSKLSATDSSNLFSMGFQFRKSNKPEDFPMYLKTLEDSLNHALGLQSKLSIKDDSMVIIKKIQEGPHIVKSLLRNLYSTTFSGDTISGKGLSITTFCESLNKYANMKMIFLSADASTISYDLRIIIDRNTLSKSAIAEQLCKQGIEAEVKWMPYYFLEFL
jgi:hypothetical protein